MVKLKSGLYETEGYHCLGNLNNDNVDLRLIYCGYENCKPGHRFGPNKRDAYVIHVIENGKGKLEMDGKIYSLKEGDAFALKPDEEAWYMADYQEPWTYMWVGFQGMRAEECVVNAGFFNGNPVIHNVNTSSLLGYVTKILETHNLSYSNSLRRCAYLQMFLADLIAVHSQHMVDVELVENGPGVEFAKKLLVYITENYMNKIRISELAYEMGVNRCYLSNSFKRLTGYSPSEYLVHIRMEKAKSLLTKTDYSINRIASEVGYSDSLAFSKIFKNRFGESPKKYREDIEQLEICNQKIARDDALL